MLNPHRKTDTNRLENIQNNITRTHTICFSVDYSSNPGGSQRSVHLGLPSLHNGRRTADVIMVQKFLFFVLFFGNLQEESTHFNLVSLSLFLHLTHYWINGTDSWFIGSFFVF